MSFEIIKNVPMPEPNKQKYNFDAMEVNDMMFIPIEEGEHHTKAQNKVSSAAAGWGKRRGRKFATQVIKHDGKLGVGLWRIE